MAKRKTIKVEKKPTGKYLWQDLQDPPKSQVKGYRTVRQGDHVVRVAILKGKGPRGGRTVATSIGHPLNEKGSSDPRVNAALKKMRRSKRRK